MEIIVGFVVFLFVITCILLTIIILLQDSKGEGLSSSAFGASGIQSVLGGRGAATFLSKLTTWLAIGFMAMSLFLMRFYGETTTGELQPLQTESQQTEAVLSPEETDAATVEQETAGADTTEVGEGSDQTPDSGDTGDEGAGK